MALHEQSVGATDEWYTPKYVFDALGCDFDLDVASPGPLVAPWIPAIQHITHNSLETSWHRFDLNLDPYFVWMNPPFGGGSATVSFLGWKNSTPMVMGSRSCPTELLRLGGRHTPRAWIRFCLLRRRFGSLAPTDSPANLRPRGQP